MAAFNFPNSPSDGDTHTENGLTYVWDGTNGAWKRSPASLSKGVKGDKGDAGTDGDKGSKGDNKGEQGDKGEPGDVTAKGAKGEPGDKGDEGNKGDKGDVEAQGNKGDEGQKGEPGDKGDEGVKGEIGSTGAGMAVGGIVAWSGSASSLPDGYFLCDGSAKSRTTYDALYAVIGTTHGAGDGSTTFNLPDLSGRFVVGYDSNNNIFDVADKGGSADATLVAHSHTITDPGHFHTTVDYVARSGYAEPRNFGVGTDGNANNTGNTNSKTTGITINSNGSSATNANLPPYYALAYIIQYAQGGDVAKGQKGEAGSDGTNGTDGDKGQKGEAGADNSTKGQKGEAGSGGGDSVWETTSAGINTSSNVGIGTDLSGSGTHLLHLFNGTGCGTIGGGVGEFVVESNNAATIQLLSPSSAAIPQTIYFGDESSVASGRIQYDHSDDSMLFKTNGNNRRFRLNSSGDADFSGNIGIGTNLSGSNTHLLHLFNGTGCGTIGAGIGELVVESDNAATIQLLSPSNGTNPQTIYFGDESSGQSGRIQYDHSSDSMLFKTNGNNERLRISSNGDVGIGTNAPATFGSNTTVLQTYNPSSYVANLVKSGTYELQMIASEFNGSSSIGTRSNHNLHLCTNDDSKVTITTNGNVGIGTIRPFDSYGTGFEKRLEVVSGGAAPYLFSGGDFVDAEDVLSVTTKSDYGGFNINVRNQNEDNPLWTIRTFQNEPIAFGQGLYEIARFDGNGNLGIGTTNPTDPVLSSNTSKLAVGIVTCHQLYVNGNEITGSGGSGSGGSSFVLLAEQSASGTEVEFTGIPADAQEITVMMKGVSLNASNSVLVQLGYSNTWIASGYVSNSENSAGTDEAHSTNGFVIFLNNAGYSLTGSMIINKASSSSYTEIGEFRRTNTSGAVSRGSLSSVSGTVERLKVTIMNQNNQDAFDAGTISVSYKTSGSGGNSQSGTTRVAVLQDVRTQGTNGGTASTNNWHQRRLNSKIDSTSLVTLVNGSTGKDGTANTFSLEAGTYFLQWRAPGFDSGDQRAKIAYTTSTNYNTLFNSQSSSGVSYLSGESAQSQTNYESNIFASGSATVTITETTYFRLQHYVVSNDAGSTKALGEAGNISGEDEIYSQVVVEDLKTAVKLLNQETGTSKVSILKDQKGNQASGGTFTGGGWRDRDLTVEEDPSNFVDFTAGGSQSSGSAGNTPGYWSLPAGDYKIDWTAPAFSVSRHKSRLVYSTTQSHISTAGLNASASFVEGTSVHTGTANASTDSTGHTIINLTQTTWFKVMHYSSSTESDAGFGRKQSSNPGNESVTGDNIYTQVRIEDLATVTKSTIGDKIEEGNTKAEVVDTGTDGKFVVTTEGVERIIVDPSGYLNARADIRLRRTSTNDGGIFFGDSNNNYIFGSDADDILTFATNGTERLRIDSGGSVGIGTTVPTSKLHVVGNALVTGVSTFSGNASFAGGNVTMTASGSPNSLNVSGTSRFETASIENAEIDGEIAHSGDTDTRISFDTNTIKFDTAGNEKLRITSSGLVLINSTGQLLNESALGVYSSGNTCVLKADGATNHNPLICWNSHGSGTRNLIQFGVTHSNGSYLARGSITTNGTATYYNSSSDYRMKQDEVLITDGIEKVKSLKPRRFKWKDNLDLGMCDGFFAHEIEDTTPTSQATIGTKDAVATESDVNVGLATSIGDPIYQQVDQTKLIPVLTAALKEAIAKIETLEAKVAALEG